MKKTRQRIAKTLIACMMAGTLAVPAFAAEVPSTGVIETDDTTVSISKAFLVLNDGYTKSYSPDITFTFSAAPANVAAGTTITDENDNTITVQAGVAGGLSSTSSLDLASQEVVETDAGATALSEVVKGTFDFEVDLTQFTQPGVYRYQITDTTPTANLYNAGIVRPDSYDTTRELDVYIERDATSGNLEVKGYVLLDETPGTIVPGTPKVPGYEIGGDLEKKEWSEQNPGPGGETSGVGYEVLGDDTMDSYTTYNMSVEKIVTGNMGDTDHQFPFAVSFENSNDNATVPANYYTQLGSVIASESSDEASTALKHEDVFHIYGLNPFAVATVTETNDTANAYTVTSSDGSISGVVTNAGADAETDPLAISTYDTVNSATDVSNEADAGDDNDLTVTNNLGIDTPTGVLLKAAPFVAIIGAFGAALAISKAKFGKKKTASDIEE